MSDQAGSKSQVEQLQETGISLEEGDTVLFNDRERYLEAVGRHKKPNNKVYRDADHYDIIELTGNNTEYHLLCWSDAESDGPMLYPKSAWETSETEDGEIRYEYPRAGERVKWMKVM